VLFGGELKDEVWRKTSLIALDLLVENFDRHAVKLRNVGVENYSLVTKEEDARFHGKPLHHAASRHLEKRGVGFFLHLRSQFVTSIIDLKEGRFISQGHNFRGLSHFDLQYGPCSNLDSVDVLSWVRLMG
jgi:hypothetical protein